MLVLSGDSKSVASMKIGRQLHSERIIRNIILRGSETIIESEGWGHYWKPCIPRWDQKLIHRLNRLKASWSTILRT